MLICAETATSILAIKLFQYFTPDPELRRCTNSILAPFSQHVHTL